MGESLRNSGKVATDLLKHAGAVVAFLSALKLPGKLKILTAIIPFVVDPLVNHGTAKLHEVYDKAVARHDFLTAVLLGFRLDLDQAAEDQVLMESTP